MNLGSGLVFRNRPEVRDNLTKISAYLCSHPVWLDQVVETLKLLVYICKMKRNRCRAGCTFNMRVLKVNQLVFAMCFETLVAWYYARLLLLMVDFELLVTKIEAISLYLLI